MTLKWSPKLGDKSVYKIAIHVETGGNKFDFGGKKIRTISKVDEKVVEVSDEFSPTLPDSSTGPNIDTESSFKPDGTFLDVTADSNQEDHYRAERLRELIFPEKSVSIGESWSVTAPDDKNASGTGFKVMYTLIGEEKVGDFPTYKIESKGRETGDSQAKSESTFWIDQKTGVLVHAHIKITGAAFPGDQGRSVDMEEDDLLQPASSL